MVVGRWRRGWGDCRWRVGNGNVNAVVEEEDENSVVVIVIRSM